MFSDGKPKFTTQNLSDHAQDAYDLLEPRMDSILFIVSVHSNGHEGLRHSLVWNRPIVSCLVIPGFLEDKLQIVNVILFTLESGN